MYWPILPAIVGDREAEVEIKMPVNSRSRIGLCCVVFACACGVNPPATAPDLAAASGVGAAAPSGGSSAGAGGTTSTPAGGKAGAAGNAGAAAPSGDLPCSVASFLQLHCVECHGKHPRLGAPMSMMDAASFQVQRSGQSVAALAAQRVRNHERPMPPSMLLPEADVAGFAQWSGAGAVPDPHGCGVRDPFDMPNAGTAGTTGADGTGSTQMPAAGSGSVATGDGDWAMFGGDLAGTRSNPREKRLGVENVAMLKELWTWRGASTTSTPAVVAGVVYLPTWDGKLHALDAQTGKETWATALPRLIDSSPAVSDKQIFVSDDDGSVHALERSHGMLQWSKRVDMHAEAHLWSSPIYVASAGIVIVGVASGEEQVKPPFSFRGSVVALDAATGNERWRFYTTTGDSSSGPGIGVWATPVVDTASKLTFIGTGNAYSDTAGQYADSMLAINYETGQLAWSRQFTTGDVFSIFGGSRGPDFDIGASANLFDVAGKPAIGIGIKSGDYAVLDRMTGMPIWMAHISGGSTMGGIIGSPAFADNKVYLASNTYGSGQSTTVAALDAQRGSVLWMQSLTGGIAYGGLTYANGVVYLGISSGAITAFNAMTGNKLWSATAPDSIAGGPSLANGVLYVPWGYTWTLREGMAGTGGLTAYGLK